MFYWLLLSINVMVCIWFPELVPGSSGTVTRVMTDLYSLAWLKWMDLVFPVDSSGCCLPLSKAFDTVCLNILAGWWSLGQTGGQWGGLEAAWNVRAEGLWLGAQIWRQPLGGRSKGWTLGPPSSASPRMAWRMGHTLSTSREEPNWEEWVAPCRAGAAGRPCTLGMERIWEWKKPFDIQ